MYHTRTRRGGSSVTTIFSSGKNIVIKNKKGKIILVDVFHDSSDTMFNSYIVQQHNRLNKHISITDGAASYIETQVP